VKFFPHLKDIAPHRTLNGELAYEIDPTWAGFSVNYVSHPRRVLFLERTSKPGCDFVPCRSEYVREFFEKSAERLPNELNEAKSFRANVIQTLSSVPAWILRTGGSPQTTAAAISDFILEGGDAPN
jgi:hypothetical protein